MNKKWIIGGAVLLAVIFSVVTVELNNQENNLPGVRNNERDIVQNLVGKKVTVLTNKPHQGVSEALADWFHQETGAIVQNIMVDYTEMRDYIIRDLNSDNPQLDIVMFWYVDIGMLVKNNALLDLTEFIEANSEIIQPGDYIPSLYNPYTQYQGKRWALPFDGDTHVLFFRKSLLEKYGFVPPETWDNYKMIAKTITEKEKNNGIYGTAIMAPPFSMMIVSSFMNRLGGFGGKLLNKEGRPVVNSIESVMALTAMIDHARYALPTPFETDWEVSRDAFLTGRVAMVEQWTDMGIMAEELSQSTIQGDWGAVQMPKGSGSKAGHVTALNAGFSLGISKKAPNSEVAKAYLVYAASPETTLKLNLINGGNDPVRVSVLASKKYKEFAPNLSGAVQSAIKVSVAWPTMPEASQLLKILTINLVKCINGVKNPKQALDDTQIQWKALLNNHE